MLDINLTPTELENLHLLAKGYSNIDIAKARYVAVATVKSQMANMISKFQANDRTHMMSLAYQYGYLKSQTPVQTKEIVVATVNALTVRGLTVMEALDILRESGHDAGVLQQALHVINQIESELVCAS